jgi:hypothetical protein
MKSIGSGLETREYCRRDLSRWPHGTFYPQKLALTSPTSGGRRTQATEVFCGLVAAYCQSQRLGGEVLQSNVHLAKFRFFIRNYADRRDEWSL